jgi:hypothetical protein
MFPLRSVINNLCIQDLLQIDIVHRVELHAYGLGSNLFTTVGS